MKVLVVGTGSGFVSGISTASDQMASLLRDMGHDVERIAAGTRPRRRPSRANLENIRAAFGDAVGVARAARRSKADLVWYHTFGVPTLPAIRALGVVIGARLTGSRAVVRFHAFGLEELVERGGRPLALVLRLLGRSSDALVAEHEHAAASLRAAAPKAHVVALPNWVDVPPAPAPIPELPPLRLVFVGGLVERKGVSRLIEAVRQVAELPIQLRLVGGPGEDGAAAHTAVRSAAADLVTAGKATFVGEVGPAEVRDELRHAHVFVLPSRAEGSPLAMLEAMAEGRPVLVSEAGNMRQIVEAAGCGVVLDSLDVATIAKAIEELVRRSDGLAAMGQRAHAAVLADHAPQSAAVAVAAMLRTVTP